MIQRESTPTCNPAHTLNLPSCKFLTPAPFQGGFFYFTVIFQNAHIHTIMPNPEPQSTHQINYA